MQAAGTSKRLGGASVWECDAGVTAFGNGEARLCWSVNNSASLKRLTQKANGHVAIDSTRRGQSHEGQAKATPPMGAAMFRPKSTTWINTYLLNRLSIVGTTVEVPVYGRIVPSDITGLNPFETNPAPE